MNKTPELSVIGFRTRQVAIEGTPYVLMLTRSTKEEYELYLKKEYDDGSSTPFMFMYGLPVEPQSATEALSDAALVAEDYDFLFEDKHWMTPFTTLVYHPACKLYECTECGSALDTQTKFCPECGCKILGEPIIH